MEPLLFHLKPPTTVRTVATTVKVHGVGGLDEARRRADRATYQEVVCRSALNPVKGMPFEWTLNPYRGCTHACHYCYARRYQTQFELDSDDQFSSVILVKTNVVDVLRRELARKTWTREQVAVGTATDVYQPIEGHYKLTRRSLEALADFRTPAGIVTKGPMCVRDIDVMQELARRAGCTVCVSVPCVDDDVWEKLEPGTAHPLQRLRAVKQLREAGINAGVLMSPIVPGISSHPDRIERTLKACVDHGAAFITSNVLFLEGGTREHFLKFVAREYPALEEGYERLYPARYAPEAYRTAIGALVERLKAKYGAGTRKRDEAAAPKGGGLTEGQPSFRW
jgi:DNA repair photolyase